MKTYSETCLSIAGAITRGQFPDITTLGMLAQTADENVFDLMAGANIIRNFFFRNQIHLCTICNAKSGKCSEDCGFCSQSKFHNTNIEIYPLIPKEDLARIAGSISGTPVNRFSAVTSGRNLTTDEVICLAESMSALEKFTFSCCASLGIIDEKEFKILKNSGITRYHHNLETAESHFADICTSHSYKDRIQTIQKAKQAGLEVCSGGIFGTGETDLQVLELALELKNLDVNAVPLNFLTPVAGTRLENFSDLTPLRCLKIISLFRYVLPEKDIIVCGGRRLNLKKLEPYIFYAGASGIMTGNYLTTPGAAMEEDLEMLEQLKLQPRQKDRYTGHVKPEVFQSDNDL